MREKQSEKNLELDRLVFFSDAVVAIAITLLALDLKIDKASGEHLSFADLARSWEKFLAFFLSFLIIAVFWKIHHQFFVYIKQVDNRILFCNLGWLLFIVMIPFGTTLISDDFTNRTASVVYSVIILAVTIFQNAIWDYVTKKPAFHKESMTNEINREFRTACNIAMVNALLAIVISFFSPIVAFIILFTRTIMFRRSAIQYLEGRSRKRTMKRKKQGS